MKDIQMDFISLDNIIDIDDISGDFSNLKFIDLLSSIKKTGLISPVILYKDEKDKYGILAGRQRIAAYKALSIANQNEEENQYLKIPAVIVKPISQEKAKFLAFEENRNRKRLSSVEQAKWFFMMLAIKIDTKTIKKNEETLMRKGIEYFNQYRSFINNTSEKNNYDNKNIKEISLFIDNKYIQLSISSLYNMSKLLFFDERLKKLNNEKMLSYKLCYKINKLLISPNSNENKLGEKIISEIQDRTEQEEPIDIYYRNISLKKKSVFSMKIKKLSTSYSKAINIINKLDSKSVEKNKKLNKDISTIEKLLENIIDEYSEKK